MRWANVARIGGFSGIARGPWDAPDVDGSIHVDPSLPVGEFAEVLITDSIAYELLPKRSVELPEEEA